MEFCSKDSTGGGIGSSTSAINDDIIAASYNIATKEHPDAEESGKNTGGRSDHNDEGKHMTEVDDKDFAQLQNYGTSIGGQQPELYQSAQAGIPLGIATEGYKLQMLATADLNQQMYIRGNLWPREQAKSGRPYSGVVDGNQHTNKLDNQENIQIWHPEKASVANSCTILHSAESHPYGYIFNSPHQQAVAMAYQPGEQGNLMQPHVLRSAIAPPQCGHPGLHAGFRISGGVPESLRTVDQRHAAYFDQSQSLLESEEEMVDCGEDVDGCDDEKLEDAVRPKRRRGRRTKKQKIKRPMNAFMVWAKTNRKLLSKKYPGMTNADISVMLGERWSSMTPVDKQPYFDEAGKIKAQHRKDFPDWTYQPKPKRQRFPVGGGKSYFFEVTKNGQGSYTTRHINDLILQQIPQPVQAVGNQNKAFPKPLERKPASIAPEGFQYVQGSVVQANGPVHHNAMLAANNFIPSGLIQIPANFVANGGILLAQPNQYVGKIQTTTPGQVKANAQMTNVQPISSTNVLIPTHAHQFVKDATRGPAVSGHEQVLVEKASAQPLDGSGISQRYCRVREASSKDCALQLGLALSTASSSIGSQQIPDSQQPKMTDYPKDT